MSLINYTKAYILRSSNAIYDLALNDVSKVTSAKAAVLNKIKNIKNTQNIFEVSKITKYSNILEKLDSLKNASQSDSNISIQGQEAKITTRKVSEHFDSIDINSLRYEVKGHNFFRGIRCWLSATTIDKHSVVISQDRHTPDIGKVINTLAQKDNNLVLLNFKKSAHSAIAIHHGNHQFSFASMYGDGCTYARRVDQSELATLVTDEMKHWDDELQEGSQVYLHKLNIGKTESYIQNNKDNYKFNIISKNCSRFAANALLAGYDGDSREFEHNRKWQMPANTLELAKEIANKYGQAGHRAVHC